MTCYALENIGQLHYERKINLSPFKRFSKRFLMRQIVFLFFLTFRYKIAVVKEVGVVAKGGTA